MMTEAAKFIAFADTLDLKVSDPIFDGQIQRVDGKKPLSGWYVGYKQTTYKGDDFLLCVAEIGWKAASIYFTTVPSN